MSTATIPARRADDAFAALREFLCGDGPAPASKITMWSSSRTGPGVRLFTSSRRAAAYVGDETRRRDKTGHPGPVTVHRLDGGLEPDRDASSEVAAVLTATGWMTRCTDAACAVAFRLRDDVVELIKAILVTAD